VQDWRQQVHALLPGMRITRVATFASFTLGVLWAGTVTLLKVAHALPLGATDLSTERRRRRWLTNAKVPVTARWRPLVKTMLASRAGHAVVLALDPMPHRDRASISVLGLVAQQRVLPLAWHLLPNQPDWPRREIVYLRRLWRVVARWLPADCTVTLVADRGLTRPDLIHLCEALGWHYVLRVSADARHGPKRRAGGPLWTVVTGPGQRWYGSGELFRRAGWIQVEVSIDWSHGYDEPWLLVSDRPAGWPRVREYRRRAHAEATYQDCTRRGWDLEASKLTDYNRLHRLLLVVCVALWWGEQLGMRVIRSGQRRRFDRLDRRALSVLRLGRCWLDYLLAQDRLPPLPFHQDGSAWRFAWLF
jgi:hypothetical protein